MTNLGKKIGGLIAGTSAEGLNSESKAQNFRGGA